MKSCGKCSKNTYEFYEDYIVVYGTNGLPFYIDIDDYKKVSEHTWRVNAKNKRVYARVNKQTIMLPKFLLNNHSGNIDHIDGNPSNNRRNNLRICTHQENGCNLKLKTNNTSGVTGVWWSNEKNKWVSELLFKGQKVVLEYHNSFIEAVVNRIKAEVKYFGKYRSYRNDSNIEKLLVEHGYNLNDILNT